MADQIKVVEITKQLLQIDPGSSTSFSAKNSQEEREFNITIVNSSEQFASFQVELITDGVDPDSTTKWYSVEPQVCAKKPPGDRTTFHVVITKAPIPAYDTTILLKIRVFSIEFENIYADQTIPLKIKKPNQPLEVWLMAEDLKVYPGDRLSIPILVYNLSREVANITLTLKDLHLDWFHQSVKENAQVIEKHIQLAPVASQKVTFDYVPSKNPPALKDTYKFIVTAEDQYGNSVERDGELEILPYGSVKFNCLALEQTIPQTNKLFGKKVDSAYYEFQFKNDSNLSQIVDLRIKELAKQKNSAKFPESTEIQTDAKEDADPLWLKRSKPVDVNPGEEKKPDPPWGIEKPRPWLGLGHRFRFEASLDLSHAKSGETSHPIYSEPNTQILELLVRPMIPIWLQIGAGLLGTLLVGIFWWMNPGTTHKAPVNSVRLIGNETTVLSGSSDETVLRWDVNPLPWIPERRRLAYREPLINAEETKQAVKVIRESPLRDGRIAVGLQSGGIQLWRVSPRQKLNFPVTTGDRVFDLDFTKESQYLFSGHGSSTVRQWDLRNPYNIPNQPIHQLQLSGIQPAGVASALAVIDPPDESEPSLVAIAGQYNRLFLWDWRSGKVYKVNYQWDQFSIQPIIGQYNYINSLAVNESNSLMVTADNRGFITTWNLDKLRQCVQRQQNSTRKLDREQQIQHNLEISNRKPESDSFGNKFEDLECGEDVRIQQWQTGQDGQSVRSVALSADGCYLATAGDDGRVALWPMTMNGQLVNEFPHGITLNSPSSSPLKTVDIKQPTTDYILVVSDAPGYRVAAYRHKVNSYHYCSSPSKLGQVPSP